MSAKTIFFVSAQVFVVQIGVAGCAGVVCTSKSVLSQCLGRAGPAWSSPAVAAPGYGLVGLAAPACGATGLGLAGYGAAGLDLAGYGAAGMGLAGYGAGLAAPAIEYTATSGGALPVSSASPIAPTGISVDSENVYEGALSVAGELPFVGAVALEGVYPTAGAGVVNHACGNGVTAIASDSLAYAPAGAYGAGLAGIAPAAAAIGPIGAIGGAAYGLGAGLGYGACGCGNGVVY